MALALTSGQMDEPTPGNGSTTAVTVAELHPKLCGGDARFVVASSCKPSCFAMVEFCADAHT